MKIAVAMSGGVDSSLAAALLAEEGHDVVGLFMHFGEGGSALAPGDPTGARRVARHLGIPLEVVDFRAELDGLVDWFCAQYDSGRTPNPCVRCNRQLKFGRLLARARELGAERLATGHYVRLERRGERILLRRGADPAKEQSYVLCRLTQDQLARALFPLGGRRKTDVRRLAQERGLPVHESKESQDICFVPGGDYVAVLRERLGERLEPGPILDTTGRLLGEHPGCQCFTIGQRRGLRVALGTPRYVVRIDRAANAVVIGTRDELRCDAMRVSDINWMAFGEPPACFEAAVQIRYSHEPVRASIEPLPGGAARVSFHTPERGVTPGQAAVFYDGDVVLGGGWIEAAQGADGGPSTGS